MNTKILFLITLTTGMYFFSACNNGTATDKANSDTSAKSSINNDTADKKMSVADTGKMENALMGAMNKMMGKMDVMEMSGNFDTDFATMMIQHHQGAIDMAQIEVSKGTDEKIKGMAQNIITKQTEEQGKLSEMVKGRSSAPPKMDTIHAEHQLHDAMINMMDKIKGMQMTGNTDKDFVMMMIPHHESAIEMAKSELLHGKNSGLKQMAKKGIADQTKEINDFKAWLSANK